LLWILQVAYLQREMSLVHPEMQQQNQRKVPIVSGNSVMFRGSVQISWFDFWGRGGGGAADGVFQK
jgi:hypothetical protein